MAAGCLAAVVLWLAVAALLLPHPWELVPIALLVALAFAHLLQAEDRPLI